MIFVEIDGTLEQLRGLYDIKGLQLQGGAHNLGGGLLRAVGTVSDRAALDEVRARGLTVHITMDEDEVKRSYEEKQRTMKGAFPEGLLEERARRKEQEQDQADRQGRTEPADQPPQREPADPRQQTPPRKP